MAVVLRNRVKETTTTTGYGAVTLLGASPGFQDFSTIGNGNTTYYTIVGQTTTEWEVGIGAYSTTGPTLTRSVLASSNANSLVNFSSGTKDVFVTYPANYAVVASGCMCAGKVLTSQGSSSIPSWAALPSPSNAAPNGPGIVYGRTDGCFCGSRRTALGQAAGQNCQGSQAVAIGKCAAKFNQGSNAVAVGFNTANSWQGTCAVAIGYSAGVCTQGIGAVAVGVYAGAAGQATYAVAIGNSAGHSGQQARAVAIGCSAGNCAQTTHGVAIGSYSGQYSQGNGAVAIGINAGNLSQHGSSVAIGPNAGRSNQCSYAVAVGVNAGYTTQGVYSIAIGYCAGKCNQSGTSVAVGYQAGNSSQGTKAVAIGRQAGYSSQGACAVAIGNSAGASSQHANSIIVNATGGALNSGGTCRAYVAPVRTCGGTLLALMYNSTSKEVTYTNYRMSYLPAPVSKSAAATLTNTELLTGYLQYTGAAANITLPTGTNINTAQGTPVADSAFAWNVINTGSGTATVVVNTGVTSVGTLTVTAGTSAAFQVRYVSANTYIIYRIS